MIQSFRLRIALHSALLAGLALAAFGFGTHWLIRSVKLDAIDRTLQAHAERETGRAIALGSSVQDWRRIEGNLAAALALRDANDLAMLVLLADGDILYRSAGWPDRIAPASLGWPRIGTPAATTGMVPSLIRPAHAQEPARPWPPAQFRPPPGDRPPPGGRPPRPEERPGFNEGRRPPADSNDPPPRYRQPEQPPPASIPRTDEPRPSPLPAPERTPAATPTTAPETQPVVEPPRTPIRPATTMLTRAVGNDSWRIALGTTPRARTATALNLRALNDEMRGIRNAFLLAMPVALFFVGLGAWVLSGRALRPVRKLTDATRRVTAEGLDQRLSAAGEDREFAELIELYNGMLERLGRSFRQAHRFSADAAHELKTPLAILQGQLERAINNVEPGSAIQAELTGILDEVRRLTTISRKLLLLSQADAGRLAIHRESFDLSMALADMLEDTQMLAPDLKVSAEIEPGLQPSADGALLRQVLHNLISNAIKYNIDHGWIHIAAKRWPKQIDVVVSNASHGIPQEDRGKLFQRFYRADPAHASKVEGVGLGLALSREIARAHGGDLSFRIDHEDAVHFTLTLPLAITKT